MPSIDRRQLLRRLGAGATAATAALAGCAGFSSDGDATPTDASERVGASYAAGSGTCHDDVDEETTGWVHIVAHGERYDVTFDAIVEHDAGEEVSVSLTHAGMDDYELAFAAGPPEESPEKTARDTACLFGTHVTGGGSLPSEFETLRVTGGGETLLTIEREGTTPRLHRLPIPVES